MTAEEYRQQLLDIAHRLTLLATGEAPDIPVPLPETTYPRVVTIQGAQFYAKAPIRLDWQPSQYARMFGARQILPDPSNAPEGRPLRSKLGYPLAYGHDGVARVLYGDSSFADDGKVQEYVNAVANSREAAEKRDQEEGYEFRTPSEVEVRVEQG